MSDRSTARRGGLLAGALLLVGALTACGVDAVPTGEGTPLTGGTITYGHDQEPPCLYGGWIQQAYLSRQFLDSLVSQDDDGEIVPWLADAWEVSDDQLTWTFTLREGVRFSDGTPLDARAVSRNFEFWLDEQGNGTVGAYLADYYETSRAVDPTTFELSLSRPYTPLLSALSQAYFGIQSPTALARGPEANCEQPVGSGPFVVEEWRRGDGVTFTRNPDYQWGPANARHQGPAHVERLVWKFLHDPVARYGSLTSGETDVIYDVPTPEWSRAQELFQVEQYITPGRPVSLALNTVKGPFTDLRVRQAFAHAGDREGSVRSAFNGVIPFEGNGSVSQSTPGYDPDAADDYPYDPERANALLDEAGWTEFNDDGYRVRDGEELRITLVYGAGYVFTPEGATMLQNLQAQVKEVGFHVTLIPATQAEILSGTYAGPDAYDAYPSYWTSPTAGILYITFRQDLPEKPNKSNSQFYNNPELEELIVRANSAATRAEADELYGRAQRLISDEAATLGLYTQTTSLAVARDLKDVWIEDSQGEPVFHDAYFVR
ncbi:ABC transporter substrate-binding protein [Streptomyces profundus]|uniref:ABC transporter substrate-binding protein n=1 Tax=Streptomyces profundus TaxID=2867410 RepID=UPI001D161D27|nr:ABC transporter substrate-binding protein [Streptomyces sp. MA3_2.13]UED87327.1 ABC transporter substrate-binding protein [Streptomyces sp. MA3_2.13]